MSEHHKYGDAYEHNAERVTEKKVIKTNKSFLDIVLDTIFATGDEEVSLTEWIARSIGMTIRDSIYDTISNALDIVFDRPRLKASSSDGNFPYRKYFKNDRPVRDEPVKKTEGVRTYDGYYCEFETRADAESVLWRMAEIIDEYDTVSVGDLYDLAGCSSSYTDNKYGWTNVDDARVIKKWNGRYTLQMPKTKQL